MLIAAFGEFLAFISVIKVMSKIKSYPRLFHAVHETINRMMPTWVMYWPGSISIIC